MLTRQRGLRGWAWLPLRCRMCAATTLGPPSLLPVSSLPQQRCRTVTHPVMASPPISVLHKAEIGAFSGPLSEQARSGHTLAYSCGMAHAP